MIRCPRLGWERILSVFWGFILTASQSGAAAALDDVLAAAHRDRVNQAEDSFASPTVDSSKVGEPFQIVLQIGDGTVRGRETPNSSFYAYDPEKGELELVLSTASERAVGEDDEGFAALIYYSVIRLGGRSRAGASYIGQNAFGVQSRVEVSNRMYDAIALVDAPGMTGPDDTSYRSYTATFTLPGPEARQIAADAVVRIEGTLALLGTGKLTRCTSDYNGPTIDHPTEITTNTCFAGARVDRIAFMRESTGEVLKEWHVDNSPAAGPVLWRDIRYGMTRKQFGFLHPEVEWPRFRSTVEIREAQTVAKINGSGGVVSSVQTTVEGQHPSSVRRDLIATYGTPREDRCEYVDSFCSAKWLTPDGVLVELSSIGSTYVRVEYSMEGKSKW